MELNKRTSLKYKVFDGVSQRIPDFVPTLHIQDVPPGPISYLLLFDFFILLTYTCK